MGDFVGIVALAPYEVTPRKLMVMGSFKKSVLVKMICHLLVQSAIW